MRESEIQKMSFDEIFDKVTFFLNAGEVIMSVDTTRIDNDIIMKFKNQYISAPSDMENVLVSMM